MTSTTIEDLVDPLDPFDIVDLFENPRYARGFLYLLFLIIISQPLCELSRHSFLLYLFPL